MRQPRTPSKLTLAHALMVLSGLLTFVLVSTVLSDRRDTQSVFVATEAAPAGSTANALNLQTIELPIDHPLTGQFVTSGVNGAERIARDIEVGQPILNNDLLPPESEVAVRTFAIEVDEVVLKGLGLRVQDHVDIIGQREDGQVYYVVTNVAVAGLSTSVDSSGFAGTSSTKFVTVEVSDAQALAISAAMREADLHLVRSTGAATIAPAAPQIASDSGVDVGQAAEAIDTATVEESP